MTLGKAFTIRDENWPCAGPQWLFLAAKATVGWSSMETILSSTWGFWINMFFPYRSVVAMYQWPMDFQGQGETFLCVRGWQWHFWSWKLQEWKQWGKGLKWCLGGHWHQSWFTTAAGQGTPFPTIPNVLWLHSMGRMPLWFHSVYKEIEHVFFPFLSTFVCNNFAAILPAGMYDYLIHICLCDDLVEIKGELMLGSRNF